MWLHSTVHFLLFAVREAVHESLGFSPFELVFGTPENYRSKEITFQVAPFSSGYHALLGREAFTIFQAIPITGT